MFKNRSIAFKQIFYILTCTVAIFVITFAHNYTATKKLLIENTEESARNLSVSVSNKLDQVFISAAQIPLAVAKTLESKNYTEDEMKQYLKSMVEYNPEIYGMCIAYEPYAFKKKELYYAEYCYRDKGNLVSSNIGNEDNQYFYQDWYQIPKEINKPLWSEPYFDDGGAKIIMCTYSVPFYKMKGEKKVLQGIVTADISLEWLQQMVSSIKILKTGYCFILSHFGTYITHPEAKRILHDTIFTIAEQEKTPSLWEIGRKMIKGGNGSTIYNSHILKKECWLYYTPVTSTNWSLAVVYPVDELFAPLNALHRNIIIMLIIGILALFLVIIFVTHKITGPLRKLAEISKSIGQGHFDIKLPVPEYNDEIGKLSTAFNSMQKALADYVENLKETTAANEKMNSELTIARDIQRSIIPKLYPAFPHRDEFEIYAALESAKAVGGDLYDFFFIDEENLCFAIGDVSGKGIPASLFMAVTQTLARAKSETCESVSDIVASTNKELCRDNDMSMFVTYFMGILNIRTGEVVYCNAGHNRPYVINKAKNTISQLPRIHGLPMGTFERPYTSEKTVLMPGDTIVLYTDGVTEAFNAAGEQFSDERLKKIIDENSSLSAVDLTNLILKEIKAFVKDFEQSDDITILILTFNGKK